MKFALHVATATNNPKAELLVCAFQLYNDTFHIWTRSISPPGSYAVAAVYSKQHGYPIHVSLPLSAINLTDPHGYNITEVFDDIPVGQLKPAQNLTYVVNPSGIYLLRATVMKPAKTQAFSVDMYAAVRRPVDKRLR